MQISKLSKLPRHKKIATGKCWKWFPYEKLVSILHQRRYYLFAVRSVYFKPNVGESARWEPGKDRTHSQVPLLGASKFCSIRTLRPFFHSSSSYYQTSAWFRVSCSCTHAVMTVQHVRLCKRCSTFHVDICFVEPLVQDDLHLANFLNEVRFYDQNLQHFWWMR